MGRAQFTPETKYAGRLLSVRRRSIENRDPKIALIRLEFEIFRIDQNQKKLFAQGTIASRDIIVTQGVASDEGVAAYVQALGVQNSETPDGWLQRVAQHPWVKIEFDVADPGDHRNPFKSVYKFNADGYSVPPWDEKAETEWVKLGYAFGALNLTRNDWSENSFRRAVDRLATKWNELL